MRIIRAVPLALAALAFVACGSSSTKKTPDAHGSSIDAPNGTADAPSGTPDAASADVGLTCSVSGQTVTGCTGLTGKSGVTCLYGQAMTGFCTAACDKAASVTANAQGTDILPADYTAAQTKGDATCTALYGNLAPSGQVHCEIPINFVPAPSNSNPPLTPNGKYTADFYCAIECGGTGQASCPAGMACVQGLCDHM